MKAALNLPFRLVKVMDMGYVTCIYVILAIFLSTVIDEALGKFDKEEADKDGALISVLKTIAHLWFAGVVIYLVRNVVELIPSPFQGIAGYDHFRLKELTTAAVFVFVFLLHQKNLRGRLEYLYEMMVIR
jgi:hypothetical protein